MAAKSRPGEAGGPACACPEDAAKSGQGHGIAGSARGRDIWGQMKAEEGSRRRAGRLSGRGGDNLCHLQLLLPPAPRFCPCQVSR